jgi:hypothetical protein
LIDTVAPVPTFAVTVAGPCSVAASPPSGVATHISST